MQSVSQPAGLWVVLSIFFLSPLQKLWEGVMPAQPHTSALIATPLAKSGQTKENVAKGEVYTGVPKKHMQF